MANPLRILYQNRADAGVITANELLSVPAANMKDVDIARIWKGTSSSGEDIRIDLAAQREIGAVALINTNVDLDDTQRVRISTTDPDGDANQVYDSGTVAAAVDPTFRRWIHIIDTAPTGRYVRFTFATDHVVTAGRLIVGPVWSPSRNVSLVRPPEEIPEDLTRESQGLGGNSFYDIRPRQRRWRIVLKGIPDAEKILHVDAINRLGIGTGMLVCFDKDSTNLGRDTHWCNLASLIRSQRINNMPDAWECEFDLKERI
jgi:hypothetical protein